MMVLTCAPQWTETVTHSFIPMGTLEAPTNLIYMSVGVWEETQVPGGNPGRHEESMQTPTQKDTLG